MEKSKMFNPKPKYATYVPAASDGFSSGVLDALKEGRPFPADLSVEDLIFWNENKLFTHPYVLQSLGGFKVGKWPSNAVFHADKSEVQIMGDSGGYQIGKGTLKGFVELQKVKDSQAAVRVWEDADHVRSWVLASSEAFTGFAMTLDMPLWATTPFGKESPFAGCTEDELIRMTVDNLKYIDFYKQDQTQWLNVIHGIDQASAERWWNAVKEFKFSGWALAGGAGTKGGLYQLLSTVLMMRDEGAFAPGLNTLHVLGVSTLKWSIAMTAIQNQLRHLNPDLWVTFDSSSPFQQAMKYEKVCLTPELGVDEANWKMSSVPCEQSFRFIGSTIPFKHQQSPIGKRLNLGHLNVKGGQFSDSHLDNVSHYILCNHNVWVYVDAFEKANDAAFGPNKHELVPPSYLQVLDIVNDAFHEQDWKSFLLRHKAALDKFASSIYPANKP
jgi:hypothetical protein